MSAAQQFSRRSLLEVGSLGLLGWTVPDILRGRALSAASPKTRHWSFGRAKSCVVVFLKGGPPQQDTFDMKPDAPSEIRGEFRPIPTNVSGIQFCEHLPRLARVADRLTVLRTLSHRDATHSTAAFLVTTGRAFPRPGEAVMSRDDPPHFGSLAAAVRGRESALPPFFMVPDRFVVNGEIRGGQNAGFLGAQLDPFIPGGDPVEPGYGALAFGEQASMEPGRAQRRRKLLEGFDSSARPGLRDDAVRAFGALQSKALDILERGSQKAVFDLDSEPPGSRDRYGRTTLGQSALLARRLIEAGTMLVHVNCMSSVRDLVRNWDLHKNNFSTLKDVLLPSTDPAVASLIEDLSDRGILDETLVLVLGEFGRSPKINRDAGRDHWPQAQSVLLAGAGIPGGRIHGATDKDGALPIDKPVSPGALIATVLHALGVDPALELLTRDGRPFKICEAEPVLDLWG